MPWRTSIKPCPCGSGKPSEWKFDAQGIPLTRACDDCWPGKMKTYRPCILTGYTQADVDEPIEEDA